MSAHGHPKAIGGQLLAPAMLKLVALFALAAAVKIGRAHV